MEIAVEDLTVRYGRHLALAGVSLHLTEGVTGLLGPNGAGKSTLMKVLATLLPPQAGRVRIGPWVLPRDQHPVRERLGYLPQQFGLPGNLTGREYLQYAAAMKGAPAAEAEALLEAVGLAEAADRPIRTYSGGMHQRLGIAQALLGDPDLVVVDEPTAGLDPEQRTRFRHLLTRRRPGRVTLFSTHVVADLDQVADRVVVLHRGQVRFTGTLGELAALAEGWVWVMERPVGAPPPPGATVVSEQWADGQVLTRVIAPKRPDPAARPVPPTPEDGYLVVIRSAAPAERGDRR
ncbi:MAG: ATP-binding cassette domain-containing protein [Firmicutes bacterium]|nr:ATP-binding cassette domain-containing protein [Bacillota bacterium]